MTTQTLLAGIYGMNFDNIPVIGMRHGYAIVMLLMITLDQLKRPPGSAGEAATV